MEASFFSLLETHHFPKRRLLFLKRSWVLCINIRYLLVCFWARGVWFGWKAFCWTSFFWTWWWALREESRFTFGWRRRLLGRSRRCSLLNRWVMDLKAFLYDSTRNWSQVAGVSEKGKVKSRGQKLKYNYMENILPQKSQLYTLFLRGSRYNGGHFINGCMYRTFTINGRQLIPWLNTFSCSIAIRNHSRDPSSDFMFLEQHYDFINKIN